MTYAAMELHEDLVEEGFDATSDEYYNEIDKRILKEFPHKFEEIKQDQLKKLRLLYEHRPLDAAL